MSENAIGLVVVLGAVFILPAIALIDYIQHLREGLEWYAKQAKMWETLYGNLAAAQRTAQPKPIKPALVYSNAKRRL